MKLMQSLMQSLARAAAVVCGMIAMSVAAQAPIAGGAALDFVVIFPAGSSADVSARILADGIAKHLEQAQQLPPQRPSTLTGRRWFRQSPVRQILIQLPWVQALAPTAPYHLQIPVI